MMMQTIKLLQFERKKTEKVAIFVREMYFYTNE